MEAHPRHIGTFAGRGVFRRVVGLIVLLLLPVFVAAQAIGDPGNAASRLRSRLDRILTNHKEAGARLGARVVELPGGRVLYDRDGHRAMIPASNMKLVVMAAAIDQLGRDYRFATVLAIRGKDLIVIGGGDPTIGDERLARRRGETITAVFVEWAEKLKAAGVRGVPGNLVIDDTIFDQQFTHPHWPANQYQKWYEAPVGGLNFNGNCTSVEVRPTAAGKPAAVSLVPVNGALQLQNKTTTGKKATVSVSRKKGGDTIFVRGVVSKKGVVGPVSVRNPGMYFGHVLKAALAEAGVRVAGEVVRERVRHDDGTIPVDCHIVAVHHSPLSDALSRAGKESLGMMAEALIKLLGHERSGVGSWRNGSQAVAAFLSKVGVPPDQFVIDEGSGLSRTNRLSPGASVVVLRHLFRSGKGDFETFRDALACAGVDGTMAKRLRSAETKGRIFAKTGYVNGVRTLSGYVHTKSNRWLAFSIFYNKAKNTAAMKKLQDEACRVLVRWPDVGPSTKE